MSEYNGVQLNVFPSASADDLTCSIDSSISIKHVLMLTPGLMFTSNIISKHLAQFGFSLYTCILPRFIIPLSGIAQKRMGSM